MVRAARVKSEFSIIHRDNALTCQRCGDITVVKDTRPTKDLGFTTAVRRRMCISCGERYSTVEVTSLHYNRITGIALPERFASTIHMLRAFLKHADEIEGKDNG